MALSRGLLLHFGIETGERAVIIAVSDQLAVAALRHQQEPGPCASGWRMDEVQPPPAVVGDAGVEVSRIGQRLRVAISEDDLRELSRRIEHIARAVRAPEGQARAGEGKGFAGAAAEAVPHHG